MAAIKAGLSIRPRGALQQCTPEKHPTSRPTDVFVLDFDGVIIDSEREVSSSAYDAAAQLWPQLFGGLPDAERQRVMAGMRATRPRLVKGFEAMVMARLILEDGSNVQRILSDWDAVLPATLAAWGEADERLAAAFEAHRAALMSGAAQRWQELNPLVHGRVYEGVGEALRECPYPFYIASSKAAHRLVSLLRSQLGLELDEQSPRLFASLIPPNERKIAALRTVMERPVAEGATLHFVDDRYETLHAVAEQAPDLLQRWKLYLADWGYNTAEERAAAARLPGVRLLSRPQFVELLRWGVIFGDIHLISTINIIIVFLISGLVLKTEDLKQAITHWKGIVYGFLAILAVTPCLGFALRALPLTPPEFAIGLTIFAAVPTTLGVGEALVRASKGNAALALLLLVGTNSLGIATMPPWLKLLLHPVQGLTSVSVKPLSLFYKLLATVLAPALIGKAARELLPPVRRFATKYKVQLGMFNTLNLACIIWQTLSGAQDVLVHQRFINIFIVICAAIIMHALYLVLNFGATIWLVRLPLKEAIAASIMSSQKSAPVAVTVISYLTPSTTQQGLLAVPCVIGQLAQIFMGAAFAPHLARIVTRREKLAALAAAEVPDPEAEARADAAAAAAEAGAACGKEAAGGSAQECEGGGCTAASGDGGGESDGDSCKVKGEDGGSAGPSETAGAGSDVETAPAR
ncbi:hypothetical protein COHA_002654 [Chlorella ohadii]|uniref:Uncharacterized protein n=1 Tax=Chlorella ohadii TaxID=2649997 RepID=A0AAD5H4P2_9CHLO|nr:hypothetical protein COHA_002654 [Chlorella ohadii]